MIIKARVPLRISFCGGGTDVSPYCDLFGGNIINATINRYASVTLKVRQDNEIVVKSLDYDRVFYGNIDNELTYDGQLDLIMGTINHLKETYNFPSGFELSIYNDAPPGSGLGSSSAVCVAIIGAFQEWLHLPLTPYDIAELAYYIERIKLKINGGRQDQYAASFGGFNFIEFFHSRVIVNPLKLRENIIDDLNDRLIIAYVGGSRNSSQIISRQIDNVESENMQAVEAMHRIKELAVSIKNTLVKGNLREFGKLLDESWLYKKSMAEGITNEKIDAIYEAAKSAGALGGKISGAGGGGYMFFFADIEKKYDVIKALRNISVEVVNYSFESRGLHSWIVVEE